MILKQTGMLKKILHASHRLIKLEVSNNTFYLLSTDHSWVLQEWSFLCLITNQGGSSLLKSKNRHERLFFPFVFELFQIDCFIIDLFGPKTCPVVITWSIGLVVFHHKRLILFIPASSFLRIRFCCQLEVYPKYTLILCWKI